MMSERDPSPAAYRWLAKLPPDVRPFGLLRQFPQFANALATRWPSKQACRTVLNGVIPNELANGKEQPATEIRLELDRLRSYLEKL